MSLSLLPEGLARAEGMSGVIIFAVVYAIVAIMGKLKQAGQKGGAENTKPAPRPRQQPKRPPQVQQRPAQRAQPRIQPPARPTGNTQVEATKLEELLRVLGQAAGVPTTEGPMGRPARVPLPDAEEVEERESLEIEERVENLETEVRRSSRKEVDFDDEAEEVVQRRIRSAAARDKALSRVDHQAFDRTIRPAVADHTRVAKPGRPSLRQAIIWREILGPPLALRDPADSDL